MRRRDTLSPEQRQDLEAIDRALAGDPVEYELRELEELALAIRATAPAMSPAFSARLEHEVGKGFPQPREQPARERRRGRRRLLLPALGSLAAVIVALVVVLAGGTRELDSGGNATTGAVSEAAPGADEAAGVAPAPPTAGRLPAPAPAPPVAGGRSAPASPVEPTQSPRKAQRSATIAIRTPEDEFARTTAAVNATVARFGGIVASSQIGQSTESGGEATYDLRIPTSRLDRALDALAKLGHVTDRSQSLRDITGSFISVQERLTDARAERSGLLRALERATTQAQIDSLRARLRSVGGQIRGLQGRLASLRRRADLARVDLTVRGTGDGSQTGGASWTPSDAAGDAVRVLEVLAGVVLIALAVLLPVGLLAAAVVLGVRFGRRRRRDAALDPG